MESVAASPQGASALAAPNKKIIIKQIIMIGWIWRPHQWGVADPGARSLPYQVGVVVTLELILLPYRVGSAVTLEFILLPYQVGAAVTQDARPLPHQVGAVVTLEIILLPYQVGAAVMQDAIRQPHQWGVVSPKRPVAIPPREGEVSPSVLLRKGGSSPSAW